MLILSQDKRTIVNLDNIKTIELDRGTNFKSIIVFRETSEVETGVCGLYIGEYNTEERAKEILQEIMGKYEFSCRIKYGGTIMLELDNYFLYKMPKN